MENKTAPTPEAAPAKKKVSLKDRIKNLLGHFTKEQKKTVVRLAIAIVLILAITNPTLIPFLPASIKYQLTAAMSSLFGNVTDISSVLPLSWVMVFKLVIMGLMLKILQLVCKVILNHLQPKTGRGKTLLHLVQSGFNYFVVFVGIFWALSILGVNLSTLFASVGIMALIVGFGAESLIADMVTGLFMIFENEYDVGDIVEISGFRGTVTSIGVRTTCVTDNGGNVKIFNNSDVRNIINLSHLNSTAICDFNIPYATRISDAEKALEAVLADIHKAHPDIFITTPEYLGVQALSGNTVTLRVSAKVSEENRFKAARLLNRDLKEGMEQLGIGAAK